MTARPDYLDATYDMFLGSIDGEQSEAIRFSEHLDAMERDDVYCFEATRDCPQAPEVALRRTTGRSLRVVNMSAYNYLGMAHHPAVIEAAKAALDRYGLGASSSPVQSGTMGIHAQLEEALARFVGIPGRGVSLFSSGYAVNTGTLSALARKNNQIVMDRAAHMSILEGAQLSRAKLSYFRHNDVDDLREVLKRVATPGQRVFVCTEGLFSADGDFGALRDIVRVSHEYGAKVLVDEAHSFLVAGPTGRGVCEEQGVLAEVDLLVLTFSKGFGGIGGALIAPREVTRYVNWYARCRMFSCAIDPAVTAGVTKALEIAAGPEGDVRRSRIRANADRLRGLLHGKVNLGTSESWIVTVVYGEEEKTIPVLDFIQTEGLDASVLQFPAVPVSEARLRLFVSSEHTPAQIDTAAEIILRAADRFGFRL